MNHSGYWSENTSLWEKEWRLKTKKKSCCKPACLQLSVFPSSTSRNEFLPLPHSPSMRHRRSLSSPLFHAPRSESEFFISHNPGALPWDWTLMKRIHPKVLISSNPRFCYREICFTSSNHFHFNFDITEGKQRQLSRALCEVELLKQFSKSGISVNILLFKFIFYIVVNCS